MKMTLALIAAMAAMMTVGCYTPPPVLQVPQPPPFSTIFHEAMESLVDQLTQGIPTDVTQRVVIAQILATDRVAEEHLPLMRGRMNVLLSRRKSVCVVEDSQMTVVLSEISTQRDFAERGIMNEDEVARLRGKTPAEFAITGEIISTKRELEITARMVSLETGLIVRSANVTIPIGILPRNASNLYPNQIMSVIEPGDGWLRVEIGSFRRDEQGRLLCRLDFINHSDHPSTITMVEPATRTYLAAQDGRSYGCARTEPRLSGGVTIPSRSSITIKLWMHPPASDFITSTLVTEWNASGPSFKGSRTIRVAVPAMRSISHV